jgi:hypothetical protein
VKITSVSLRESLDAEPPLAYVPKRKCRVRIKRWHSLREEGAAAGGQAHYRNTGNLADTTLEVLMKKCFWASHGCGQGLNKNKIEGREFVAAATGAPHLALSHVATIKHLCCVQRSTKQSSAYLQQNKIESASWVTLHMRGGRRTFPCAGTAVAQTASPARYEAQLCTLNQVFRAPPSRNR